MHKIATCCYCGTRAALVMRSEGRHELSCAACGAPLHNMKAIPARAHPAQETSTTGKPERRAATPRKMSKPRKAPRRDTAPEPAPHRPSKRRKPRRGLMKKVFEEIWDVVEDVFD
ncbi:hypothetical protein O4H61_07505 [Roseovarius aestuarii]|nr:hypothetical protein [Roseovarius aestuarii]